MDALLKEIDGKIVAKARAPDQAAYARALRSVVYGLWAGRLDLFSAVDAFFAAMRLYLPAAWLEGVREAGISPSEMTVRELAAMREATRADYNYVMGFARAIEKGSKANKGKLAALQPRLSLWVNRYASVRNQALQMAGGDQKLEWVRDARDSCSSCLMLEGRIYRASVWLAAGLRPQGKNLACQRHAKGATVCRCSFRKTDKPATPGTPPSI